MSRANLFRLGMDLETGATHEEDTGHHRGRLTVVSDRDSVRDAGRAFNAGEVRVRKLLRGEGLVEAAG